MARPLVADPALAGFLAPATALRALAFAGARFEVFAGAFLALEVVFFEDVALEALEDFFEVLVD